MRVALIVLGAQTDLSHHRLHFFPTFCCRQFGVDQQRLAELVTDFLAWVERRVRALEDHLYVFAQLLALGLAGTGHFLASDFQRTR